MTLTKIIAGQLVGCLLATCAFASQKQKPKSCWDTAETQMEMNQCAGSELQAVDKELNRVYQQILKEYAGDRVFIEKFKAAQRAWLNFRDAELEAVYPHGDNYGSAHPMCHTGEKAALTLARTKQLKLWLHGTIEGDLCAGSVKSKSSSGMN
jgi:uncharacterized protein YecT (DUF1311 family)